LGINATKHIDSIIDHPEAFDLAKEMIEQVYKKYNEPYGFEGKAREEIIHNLITQKGWVRIRHYQGKGDKYTVQIGDLDTTRKDYLWWWANAELEEGYKPNDWPNSVYIDILNERRVIVTSLTEIINERLLNETEKKNIKRRLQENEPEYIETPQQFLGPSPAFKRMHSGYKKLKEEEEKYNSQHCIDQCFECLRQSIDYFSQILRLNESTAGGGAFVRGLDDRIQQAATWYKHLVENYNESELIIKEIESELAFFNDFEIPYFNQVAIAYLKHPKFDSEDKEAIHKRLTQIKQILDGLNSIISKYLIKMHISDSNLKLDQLKL
jgi:hypothetical protein